MREKKSIPIEQITPNRHQPRQQFDQDSLFELAQSIRANGLLQPIVVRPASEGYEIIAGERRYRASVLAGHTEIESIIDDVDDDVARQLALIENIQRENLSVIEEALAYQSILTKEGLTQQQLADMVGKSQSSIANKLRLLKLPENVVTALNEKVISERHGRALLSAKTEVIEEAFQAVLRNEMSVKATEQLVERLNERKTKKINLSVFSKPERLAINTINQAVSMVKKTGLNVDVNKHEDEEHIVLEIKIKRKGG